MTEIDVSGCKYYENGFCCEFPDFRTICEQNDTCDYKQFKFLKQTKNELWQENTKLKEKLEKIEKVILRCKEANCTNCEYQDKCNFNGDDFDDYILRIIRGAEE